MNVLRKDKLKKIAEQLKHIIILIDSVKMEEERVFDNIPENLQYSKRGEESQEAIDTLEEVIELLEEAVVGIKTIV